MMSLNDARQIGASKLGVDKPLFDKSLEVAHDMGVLPLHKGPMTLALAILGLSKATKAEDMSSELTDALSLVAKAEEEWKMEQLVGRGEA